MNSSSSMNVQPPDPVGDVPAKSLDRSSQDPVAVSRIGIKNILVPLDFSEMSMKSLRYAIPFAQRFGAGLTLLHVVAPPAYTPELPFSYMCESEGHEAARTRLEEIRESMVPEGIEVECEVCHNFVFEGILKVARDREVDLIITTTHGHTGLQRVFSGSAAENVVRRAPCPVLVVREVEREFIHEPEESADHAIGGARRVVAGCQTIAPEIP